MTTAEATASVAELNDRFRKGDLRLGVQRSTEMVEALNSEQQQELFRLVRIFNQFTPENNPHGERDFGTIYMDGEKYFWKIDSYDLEMDYQSGDPSNPGVTRRLLTIMHSSEY